MFAENCEEASLFIHCGVGNTLNLEAKIFLCYIKYIGRWSVGRTDRGAAHKIIFEINARCSTES